MRIEAVLESDPLNKSASFNAQTGTTYTLTGADNGKVVTLSNAGAITLTFPELATESMPVGFTCTIVQRGAGTVTCVVEGTDTIESSGALVSLGGQHSAGTVTLLSKGSPNVWGLYGSLA